MQSYTQILGIIVATSMVVVGCADEQHINVGYHVIKIDYEDLNNVKKVGVIFRYDAGVRATGPDLDDIFAHTESENLLFVLFDHKEYKESIKSATQERLPKYFTKKLSEAFDWTIVDITDSIDCIVYDKDGYVDYDKTTQKNGFDIIIDVSTFSLASVYNGTFKQYYSYITIYVRAIRAADGILVWDAGQSSAHSYRKIDDAINNAVDTVYLRLQDALTTDL